MRNVRDSVPKAIGYFLVKAVQEKMQYMLYSEIMKNVEILDQLGEVPPSSLLLAPPHCRREEDPREDTRSTPQGPEGAQERPRVTSPPLFLV